MHQPPDKPQAPPDPAPEPTPASEPVPESNTAAVVPGTPYVPPPTRQQQLSQVWVFVGVLIVLTMLGGLLIVKYRKIMLGGADEPDDTKGLMNSLRELRDSGEMSEEEYQQTRRRLVEKMAARFEGISSRRPGSHQRPKGHGDGH